MSSVSLGSSGQERQNRKLLEQLEEQKKRLRQQTSALPTKDTQSLAHSHFASSLSTTGDIQPMTTAQKTALEHANANSVGYFIIQDSAFGNLILPVLPRFETGAGK